MLAIADLGSGEILRLTTPSPFCVQKFHQHRSCSHREARAATESLLMDSVSGMISIGFAAGDGHMGLENRDYYRDGSYSASLAAWGVDFTPVVKYLIIANVAVFLLQIFFTRPATASDFPGFDGRFPGVPRAVRDQADDEDNDGAPSREQMEEAARKAREMMEKVMSEFPGMRVSVVQEWLQLSPEKTIYEGQVWRLITCAFCHQRTAIWHILFNMVMLYWFGTRLERMYGSREFLLFYLAAAVCSSLAYVGLAFYSGSNAPAIGASGAVMGVMMLYVIYYPFETFLLAWFVPVPLWVLLSVYVLYDLHPVLLQLAGDQVFTGVAHAGHLGGLAFGFVYWRFGLRLEAPFEGARRRPRRRRPPYREPAILSYPTADGPAESDDLADRVDAVLKKISAEGTDSLTDAERNILIQASAKYRDKKQR
jgi:membrane associated rhomboid family serine protease